MQKLDDYINQIEHLPPAPKLLPPLLALLQQPDLDISRVIQLIVHDPALTASVLRLSNSVAFSRGAAVENLGEAIARLGFETVYRLVVTVCGSKMLQPRQAGYALDPGELWQHSVTAAVAAQIVARHCHADPSLAFTAGLLHDLGKLVLSQALEGRYAQVAEQVEQFGRSMLEAEKALLGVQHAEVGARVLARWNFPASLVNAVCYHHQPEAAGAFQRLAACTYAGNMIANLIGQSYGIHALALQGRAEAMTILGISADDFQRYMIRTQEEFQGVEALVQTSN